MEEDVSGIYLIRNTVNGKVYVGQAVNIRKRWNVHLHHLRRGTHANLPLKRAFKRYGEDAFSFEILEEVQRNRDALNCAEERFIAELRACEKGSGYNLTAKAGTNLGYKYSSESRARMSAAQKGRSVSVETRALISQSLTGKIPTKQCLEKRSKAMKGRKYSSEHVEAIRKAHREKNKTPLYEAFGKSQTIRDWSDEYGINKGTLSNRINRGEMSMEDALTCGNIKGKRNDIKEG